MANFTSKREFVARALHAVGIARMLRNCPSRSSLCVLNYHRIGSHDDDLFDPGIFSTTAAGLDYQMGALTRCAAIVGPDEALSFIAGKNRQGSPRNLVLITFDDGYLDNYSLAYPILRSHGVSGVFFLATQLVGSSVVPWWDRIAYIVRTAKKGRFILSYPRSALFDLRQDGLSETIIRILRLYKDPATMDQVKFVEQLVAASGGEEPARVPRRFLDWTEAREMSSRGMAFGAHTVSHPVLSQLPYELQCQELKDSRVLLEQRLGRRIKMLAYPVGARSSFTADSKNIAARLGYQAAFSFYGGVNLPGAIDPFDVKRIGADSLSPQRIAVQAAVCRVTGKYWP